MLLATIKIWITLGPLGLVDIDLNANTTLGMMFYWGSWALVPIIPFCL